jgi:hypothetical protein
MNPHSPTDSWLKAVAGVGGYSAEPEVGDADSMLCERPSGTYEVTVERVE